MSDYDDYLAALRSDDELNLTRRQRRAVTALAALLGLLLALPLLVA